MGNGEDGLHLATSADGLSWTALNKNESFLTPTAGDDKLMRDPCIIKEGDGLFHMVWTVSWNEKGIGYANSPDLMNMRLRQGTVGLLKYSTIQKVKFMLFSGLLLLEANSMRLIL